MKNSGSSLAEEFAKIGDELEEAVLLLKPGSSADHLEATLWHLAEVLIREHSYVK